MSNQVDKILVTSQKGGVGKSTLSANLTAFFREVLGRKAALVDFDYQATSSKWLSGAEKSKQEHALFQLEKGVSQGITALNANRTLREATKKNDIVVADLTWTDVLPKEFFFEFDLLLVPCSLSTIEIDSTMEFLERMSHILNSKIRNPPKLVIVPSRIRGAQDYEKMLSRIFNIEFFLSPPVSHSELAQDYFCNTFLFDSPVSEIRDNFINFAKSIDSLLWQMRNEERELVKPKSLNRDAGSILDRYMLTQSAKRKSEKKLAQLHRKDLSASDKTKFLPSFLTSSNSTEIGKSER